MALTWYFGVDWNADGTLEADEAGRMIPPFRCERGRKRMVRRDGKGFEKQPAGRITATLDNYDGRYDPYNTSSPLYPNVRPGRDVYVTVNDGVTTYPVMRGRIDDIVPRGSGENSQVTIVIKDGWQQLADNEINYATQTGIRADTAIGYILDRINYIFGANAIWRFTTYIGISSVFGPPSWTRNLGAGNDTLPYWYATDVNGVEAINDLVESEFGAFWFANDGRATFLGRRSFIGQVSAFTLDQSQILKEIPVMNPWETVRNKIRVQYYPRVLQSSSVLWTLRDTPLVAPGVTQTVYANFTYSSRKVAIVSVGSYNYTMNSAADGSGTNLSANFSVAVTAFGEAARVEITNNGAVNGYVTLLTVTAQALDVPDKTTVEANDELSQASGYGTRDLFLDLKWQQSQDVAQGLANYLRTWMGTPQKFPKVRIENRSTIQFAYDLFTKFTLTVAKLGINADFMIGGIDHEWNGGSQSIKTTWHLEPGTIADTFWIFPTTIGVKSVFGY